MEWIWGLILGAVGGNLAGYLLKAKSLGYLWNSVVGILGGVIGWWVLDKLSVDGSGTVLAIVAALIGGAVLLWIVSLFKK